MLINILWLQRLVSGPHYFYHHLLILNHVPNICGNQVVNQFRMAQHDIHIGQLAFVYVTFVRITFKFFFGYHLPILFRLNIMDMPVGVGNDMSTLGNSTWERIKHGCLFDIL